MLDNISYWLNHPFFLPVISSLLAGGLLGYLLSSLHQQKKSSILRVRNAELQTLLESEQHHYETQISLLQQARESLANEFAQLSQKALKQNNGLFLRLAEQSLKMQSARSSAELESRQQSIEYLLQPMRDTLAETQSKLAAIEQERARSFGALDNQLKQLLGSEVELRSETRNLVNALKKPDVRGRWGELSLRRVAELSGMIEYCDFQEQVDATVEERTVRPDMVVKLPGSREIVVDAKTPLNAYLESMDANSPAAETEALKQHARQVKQRVTELSSKVYWQQFQRTPEFVVMFIPGDQFLSSALEQDGELLERAMQQQVVIATPSSLIALLRAVEFGWRQDRFSDNAEEIREIAESLQKRMGTFIDHLSQLGKSLDSSLSQYNKAIGSLNRNVLPATEKMSNLGISRLKTKSLPQQLDGSARTPTGPED